MDTREMIVKLLYQVTLVRTVVGNLLENTNFNSVRY